MVRLATISIPAVLLVVCCLFGCASSGKEAAGKDSLNPLQPLNRLLELHGLVGKQPEERSDAEKRRSVKRSELEPLFLDLDNYDEFLSNLYVGFIVGAVARHQRRLYVSKTGDRASVAAGRARIILFPQDGVYRISLRDSIPPEIVHRAELEKKNITSGR